MKRAYLTLSVALVLAALTACQGSSPAFSPTVVPPSSTPNPETAEVGQSALPLGCADLVVEESIATLGEGIVVRVDEARLAPRLNDVGRVQEGALLCVWGDDEYGGTGASAGVQLAVAPTDATSFDLAAEGESFFSQPTLTDDEHPTFSASCYGDAIQSYCTMVQLRDSYRVEISTFGRGDSLEGVTAFTADLLDGVGSAIDNAGPARVIAAPPPTDDASAVCRDPALSPALKTRGADGEPEVREYSFRGGPVVTTCVWVTSEPSADYTESVEVSVLPGGSWAIPALVAGPRIYPFGAEPTVDGSRLVGCGDGCGAILALGDDLVMLGDSRVDTDPAEWAALVAQID